MSLCCKKGASNWTCQSTLQPVQQALWRSRRKGASSGYDNAGWQDISLSPDFFASNLGIRDVTRELDLYCSKARQIGVCFGERWPSARTQVRESGWPRIRLPKHRRIPGWVYVVTLFLVAMVNGPHVAFSAATGSADGKTPQNMR